MTNDLIGEKRKPLNPKQIVEIIMTQHWDMAACRCWVCTNGRGSGCHAKDNYLPHKALPAHKLPTVSVGGEE